MYGFIYITTNNVNGKKYIGQKKYDKNGKWKKYLEEILNIMELTILQSKNYNGNYYKYKEIKI